MLISTTKKLNSNQVMDNLESSHNSQDDEILEQSFVRNTQTVIQNGYADGVADGRETLYQKDFNRGYRSGFHMAFKLAQHQGFAAGVQKITDKAAQVEALKQDLALRQDAARAHCLLCSDKALEQGSLKEIDTAQTKHNEVVLATLKDRYGIS